MLAKDNIRPLISVAEWEASIKDRAADFLECQISSQGACKIVYIYRDRWVVAVTAHDKLRCG